MPCNGIAVMTAYVNVNLEAHMREPEHRQAFVEWLRMQDVPARNWWQAGNPRRPIWALGIGSDWTGLKFVENTIELSDEGQYQQHKTHVDTAFVLAQRYAGQLAQADILEAFTALGLPPENLNMQPMGLVKFMINAGLTVQVTIYPDGTLDLVTQEGDFAGGKTALEALLAALQAQGVGIQQSGQVETHRHDLQLTYTSEHSATVHIHEAIREGGAPHTH